MGRYVIVGLSLVIALAGLATCTSSAEKGFSGTLHFTNGDSVFFDHLGTTSEVMAHQVSGLLGQQKVSYKFAELGLILFSDKEPTTVIVVNKQGERFTLTDCEIKDGFLYVYNDPVTHELDWTRAERKSVSHIVVGKHSGKIKMNLKTLECFPAMFIFDPFTGERLSWAEQGRPVPGKPLPAPVIIAPSASAPAAIPAPAAPSAPATQALSPSMTEVATTPHVPAGTKSNLRLTVITPSVAVFFLADLDLKVSIRGPERFAKSVKDADVETEYTLSFDQIPSGDYRIVAKFGSRTAVSIIRVVGDNVEAELCFD